VTLLWGEDLASVGRMLGDAVTPAAAEPTTDELAAAAVVYRPGTATDPAAVLEQCQGAGAAALVVVSSARVYGASPGNDMQLDERAETVDSFDDPDLGSLAEADRVLAAAADPRKRSGMYVVVIRPVQVLGDPSASPLALALASGRLRTNVGFDPIIQVIHRDDVGSAVAATLRHGLHGVYNVCGPGALPLSVLARETGATRVGGIGGVVADLAGRFGLGGPAHIPPSELRYPINVSDRAFRTAARWKPTLSLSDTVTPAERAPS
jgi:UDP-glucose 4-epimerase